MPSVENRRCLRIYSWEWSHNKECIRRDIGMKEYNAPKITIHGSLVDITKGLAKGRGSRDEDRSGLFL